MHMDEAELEVQSVSSAARCHGQRWNSQVVGFSGSADGLKPLLGGAPLIVQFQYCTPTSLKSFGHCVEKYCHEEQRADGIS